MIRKMTYVLKFYFLFSFLSRMLCQLSRRLISDPFLTKRVVCGTNWKLLSSKIEKNKNKKKARKCLCVLVLDNDFGPGWSRVNFVWRNRYKNKTDTFYIVSIFYILPVHLWFKIGTNYLCLGKNWKLQGIMNIAKTDPMSDMTTYFY